MNKKEELNIDKIRKDRDHLDFIRTCNLKADSYVSKEEFINIINMLNFKAVRRANLDLITDIIVNANNEEMQVLSKQIDID